MTNVSRAVFAGLAICCIPFAGAQSLSDQQVRDCAAQSNSAARLACYDQLASGLGETANDDVAAAPSKPTEYSTAAHSSSAPVVVNSPYPISQFGVSGGKLQAKREDTSPKQIEAVVSGVAKRPRGELVVTLDNGQVWAQLVAQDYYPLKSGDIVHISKGALGSYLMTTPAKRGSKVTRLL